MRCWAKHYGMEYHNRVAPVDLFSSSTGIQDKARDWRREECLELIKGSSRPSFVATAHQKEDQLETLLLKLLRGVHISNINTVRKDLRALA